MKSKIISLILVLTLILSTTSVAMAATTLPKKPVSVVVNGTAVQYNDQTGYPFKDGNNRVQVPFRQTLEAFGAEVEWNQQINTAIAKKGNVIVEVPIGVNFILKDGKQIANDTVAVVQNGKTYLPIRVVFESFGLQVKWDEVGQSVVAIMKSDISKEQIKLVGITYDEFKSMLILNKEIGERLDSEQGTSKLYHYELSFNDNVDNDVFLEEWNKFYDSIGESYLRRLSDDYSRLVPYNDVALHIYHNSYRIRSFTF